MSINKPDFFKAGAARWGDATNAANNTNKNDSTKSSNAFSGLFGKEPPKTKADVLAFYGGASATDLALTAKTKGVKLDPMKGLATPDTNFAPEIAKALDTNQDGYINSTEYRDGLLAADLANQKAGTRPDGNIDLSLLAASSTGNQAVGGAEDAAKINEGQQQLNKAIYDTIGKLDPEKDAKIIKALQALKSSTQLPVADTKAQQSRFLEELKTAQRSNANFLGAGSTDAQKQYVEGLVDKFTLPKPAEPEKTKADAQPVTDADRAKLSRLVTGSQAPVGDGSWSPEHRAHVLNTLNTLVNNKGDLAKAEQVINDPNFQDNSKGIDPQSTQRLLATALKNPVGADLVNSVAQWGRNNHGSWVGAPMAKLAEELAQKVTTPERLKAVQDVMAANPKANESEIRNALQPILNASESKTALANDSPANASPAQPDVAATLEAWGQYAPQNAPLREPLWTMAGDPPAPKTTPAPQKPEEKPAPPPITPLW
ncbi:MAG: hypothetical protein VKK59_03350 [Vampirovibrionales bacterium]|nr:hypothetical protein [Vampirovibrionales bacterium]